MYDQQIEEMAKHYPVDLLTPVYGVGTLIALTFVLTIDDPERFVHSRDVGPFLGLQPKQRDSGDSQPQTGDQQNRRSGDRLMRTLLVQAAHGILRKGAPDSDLRAWGESKMGNGENAKLKRRSDRGSGACQCRSKIPQNRRLKIPQNRRLKIPHLGRLKFPQV